MSEANKTFPLQPIFYLVLVTAIMVLLWTQDGEGLLYRYVNADTALVAMIGFTFLYIVLMAVPFVPGMELGWLLMGAFGIPGILAAWLGTVAGLTLGFTLARRSRKLTMFKKLTSRRAALETTDPATLTLTARSLQRCLNWQQQHPYFFLLVALNLPGNLVIGGGGGIAWISGLTPGVRAHRFLLVAACATAAVPLVLLVTLIKI